MVGSRSPKWVIFGGDVYIPSKNGPLGGVYICAVKASDRQQGHGGHTLKEICFNDLVGRPYKSVCVCVCVGVCVCVCVFVCLSVKNQQQQQQQ